MGLIFLPAPMLSLVVPPRVGFFAWFVVVPARGLLYLTVPYTSGWFYTDRPRFVLFSRGANKLWRPQAAKNVSRSLEDLFLSHCSL